MATTAHSTHRQEVVPGRYRGLEQRRCLKPDISTRAVRDMPSRISAVPNHRMLRHCMLAVFPRRRVASSSPPSLAYYCARNSGGNVCPPVLQAHVNSGQRRARGHGLIWTRGRARLLMRGSAAALTSRGSISPPREPSRVPTDQALDGSHSGPSAPCATPPGRDQGLTSGARPPCSQECSQYPNPGGH
jgi:hypothetical protein